MGLLSNIFHHPRLGELRWQDEGWWEGVWIVAMRSHSISLEFAVHGDREGPAGPLVSALERTLGNWPDVDQQLRRFLASKVPPETASVADSLEPISVSYLWPARPECFAVELTLEGDEGAIWRVEFERGEPKHLGRDD